jgi:UDPglucose--hexose-1-phosphate uridylyltransferase
MLLSGLLRVTGVRGQCHVICFSPAHNLTIAEMSEQEILPVVKQWVKCYDDVAKVDYINHVQIFENKGSAMGCSNPHPHGQMWCTEDVPEEPSKEIKSMAEYRQKNHSCLLCDYAKLETSTQGKPRVVCENDSFVCVVPFWAVWPFETMVVAKHHVTNVSQLDDAQQKDLANILRRIACRYDNVFQCSFPYSMGIHQAPVDGKDHSDDTHLHIHFYPPLLRSATVKKFLVG